MSDSSFRLAATADEPISERLPSAQPGGGWGYELEQSWARWRRWRLRQTRGAYLKRMAHLRRGPATGAPHDILDPRDLKYAGVCCDCQWDAADDPFQWRRRIPLARWGWIEMVVSSLVLGALAAGTASAGFWPLSIASVFVGGWVFWFFRDPPRQVPVQPGLIVSPADGKIVEVAHLPDDEFVGGPAVKIGIFLSVFNVHVNRAPCASQVVSLRYQPGKFLNALLPASARENENMWIGLQEPEPTAGGTPRRLWVRQIAGAIARRIICDLKPGQPLERGARFGMIKFGSRTELVLPAVAGLELLAHVGDRVQGGSTVLARYADRG